MLDGAHRQTTARLPQEPIREALVNAVAHRDYLLLGRQVQVRVFADGVEVLSPGRPANGVTIESMKLGERASHNELIMDVLRDYNYVDRLGMGISRKIIRIMREFNGTEPLIQLDNETLQVRLAVVD